MDERIMKGGAGGGSETIKVWDPFVRIFHWTLAAAFTVSAISEGEPRWLHVWSGYIITGLVLLRIIWGFVGPRYARFSEFVRGPGAILRHLFDVIRLRSGRYVGHDPAGGAMIVALLLFLLLTVTSGMLLYAAEDKAGPFAGWIAALEPARMLGPDEALANGKKRHGGRDRQDRAAREEEEFYEDVHETLFGITLGLVLAHIGGVILVSLQTKENLAWSMITGRKKRHGP